MDLFWHKIANQGSIQSPNGTLYTLVFPGVITAFSYYSSEYYTSLLKSLIVPKLKVRP